MYNLIEQLEVIQETPEMIELRTLAQVWRDRKEDLHKTGAYKEFLVRLQREWAIETGIIERLYSWDRGVTQTLIEEGIEAAIISHSGGIRSDRAAHITNIINDQLEIVQYLFEFVKGDEPLSELFIRNLQAQFTAHQDTTEALTTAGQLIQVPLLKGQYKQQPNNPSKLDGRTHEYCPPILVKDEMERLVKWYHEYENKKPPEVVSAWLHHRFTQIHPFQDGNGRVARALASLVFLRCGLFPLVILDRERKGYIEALELADQGDLAPLVKMFANRQRRAILSVLGLQQQVEASLHADSIIQSAIQVLKDKFAGEKQKFVNVNATADNLLKYAEPKAKSHADSIKGYIRSLRRGYDAYVTTTSNGDNKRGRYYYNQIVDVANKLGYFANVKRYHSWLKLSIKTDVHFEYVLSFHGFGPEDNGLMAASAFSAIRVPRQDEGRSTDVVDVSPACPDLFQFNYAEKPTDVESRFQDWLDQSFVIALAEWKRHLA